jgi:hypothetical protein
MLCKDTRAPWRESDTLLVVASLLKLPTLFKTIGDQFPNVVIECVVDIERRYLGFVACLFSPAAA